MGFLLFAVLLILIMVALLVASQFLDKLYSKVFKYCSLGMLVLLGIITVIESAQSVPAGHIGLIYSFGAISGQRSEGLQWIAPWQSVQSVSIQTQGHKFEKMTSFSKESQIITVTATVNARVNSDKIQPLYRDVGKDYFNILIQPRVLQAFKDETVKYSSVDIAPSRELIRANVRDALVQEMSTRGILIEDLLIDDIAFEAKFEEAIEEKQAQTQLALAEQMKVGSEKAKADQKIEQARGESESILILAKKQAEANKVLSDSLSAEYLQYLYISKISPNIKVIMLPQAGQSLLLDSSVLDGVK